RLGEKGAELLRHPPQPSEDLRGVRAVAQHLAQSLVEGTVRAAPVLRVLEHPHPHGRGDDARHRADGRAVVARLDAHVLAGGEQRLGVLRVVDEPLESGGTHERAPHRTGGALPDQRWAGAEELPPLDAEDLAGRGGVDDHGLRAEHGLDLATVRLRAQGLGRDGREVGLGALHGWAPVDTRDRDRLRVERIGEDAGTRRGDAGGGTALRCRHAAAPISERARAEARALDRWTSAPASASAVAWSARTWGSPAVPTQETMTASSRPASLAVARASRIAGAVVAAGSASAAWPRTTAMRTTDGVGDAEGRERGARRRGGTRRRRGLPAVTGGGRGRRSACRRRSRSSPCRRP